MGLDAGKILGGAASTAANTLSGGLTGMGLNMLSSLFGKGMSEQEAMNLAHANRIAKSDGSLEKWQQEQQQQQQQQQQKNE